jgi:hypothetical protein
MHVVCGAHQCLSLLLHEHPGTFRHTDLGRGAETTGCKCAFIVSNALAKILWSSSNLLCVATDQTRAICCIRDYAQLDHGNSSCLQAPSLNAVRLK